MNKDELSKIVSEPIPKIEAFEKDFYKDVEDMHGAEAANALLVARDAAYIKGVVDCLTDNDVSIATNLVAALIRIQAFRSKEDE